MPKLKRVRPRAKGEGSIFKRTVTRRDGSSYERWEAAVSLGYDGDGKRKRVTVYAPTQAGVLAKIESLKKQVSAGTLSDERRTVKEYLRDWLEYKSLEVKPRTYEFYKFYCDSYITPSLGSIKLTKLTTTQVKIFCWDSTRRSAPTLQISVAPC